VSFVTRVLYNHSTVLFCHGFLTFFTEFYCFLLFSQGIECFLAWFSVRNRKLARRDECSYHLWHMCYSTTVRCYFAVFFACFSICSLSLSISHATEWFLVWLFVFGRKIARYIRSGPHIRHTCAAPPVPVLFIFSTFLTHLSMFWPGFHVFHPKIAFYDRYNQCI